MRFKEASYGSFHPGLFFLAFRNALLQRGERQLHTYMLVFQVYVDEQSGESSYSPRSVIKFSCCGLFIVTTGIRDQFTGAKRLSGCSSFRRAAYCLYTEVILIWAGLPGASPGNDIQRCGLWSRLAHLRYPLHGVYRMHERLIHHGIAQLGRASDC